MKLNHLNLCASDVPALCGIFARHFGFEFVQAQAEFALLRGSDGFFLVLTRIGPDSPKAYPSDFHVGFMVDTPEEVRAKHAELSAAGCHPDAIRTFEAMGADWTAFYCPVGDGIAIEVNSHILKAHT